jgi:hypothetical protein
MKSTFSKLLVTLTLSSLACLAAEKAPKNFAEEQLDESVKTALSRMPAPHAIFNIDFPGGTIREFLSVTMKTPASISIISAGEASDLDTPLPPFALRNTNAIVTLQVLARLLMPRGFDLVPMDSGPNSAVAVLSRHQDRKPVVRQAQNDFESFQLAHHLQDQSIDDIVGAIRAAWELDPQRDPNGLRLKFHPATSILLVSGPRDGLNMASKIISQLKQRPPADLERHQAVADEAIRRREVREKSNPSKSTPPPEKK